MKKMSAGLFSVFLQIIVGACLLGLAAACHAPKAAHPTPPPMEKRLPKNDAPVPMDTLFELKPPAAQVHSREKILQILWQHEAKLADIQHLQEIEQFEMHYLVFPLRVALVVNPARPDFLTKAKILKGTEILNRSLSDAWLQFRVVRVDTIFEAETINSLKFDGYNPYYQFSARHDLRDTTTLYLVDNEENLCADYSCSRTQGFANILETSTNNVVLDKFFADDFKVVPHEFGHYLGLYHTAESGFGLEKVDGSNCSTAGDRVCDTPADPGELYAVYVNYSNCEMKGLREEDTGREYRPSVNNYMSYYSPCYFRKFTFSQGQLDVMFQAAIGIRRNQIIDLGEVPEF